MATPTTSRTSSAKATLKAYEDKVAGQLQDAKDKLTQVEARTKAKGVAAETAAVGDLKAARDNIDRKLQDLKTTHDTHVSRAKADIDGDVAKFKTSVDNFAAKFKH